MILKAFTELKNNALENRFTEENAEAKNPDARLVFLKYKFLAWRLYCKENIVFKTFVRAFWGN